MKQHQTGRIGGIALLVFGVGAVLFALVFGLNII